MASACRLGMRMALCTSATRMCCCAPLLQDAMLTNTEDYVKVFGLIRACSMFVLLPAGQLGMCRSCHTQTIARIAAPTRPPSPLPF